MDLHVDRKSRKEIFMKKKNDGVKTVGRVSAVIAMVVLILAAIPVGACISLSRERNNVTA